MATWRGLNWQRSLYGPSVPSGVPDPFAYSYDPFAIGRAPARLPAPVESVEPEPLPAAPTVEPLSQPVPEGISGGEMAARIAQDVAFGRSDWERAGQALMASGEYEDASGLKRAGAVLGGTALGALAIASWIPGFNVFKPAQAARAARAFGQGASAGARAGTGILRGGWDEAKRVEDARRAQRAADKAARSASSPQPRPPDPERPMVVNLGEQSTAGSRRFAASEGRPLYSAEYEFETSFFPHKWENWPDSVIYNTTAQPDGRNFYSFLTSMAELEKEGLVDAYQRLGSRSVAELVRRISPDYIPGVSRSVITSPDEFFTTLRSPIEAAQAAARPGTMQYAIDFSTGAPVVRTADEYAGRYIVREVGSDFYDPSYTPDILRVTHPDTLGLEYVTPRQVGDPRIGFVARPGTEDYVGAQSQIWTHHAPHLLRDPRNVLYTVDGDPLSDLRQFAGFIDEETSFRIARQNQLHFNTTGTVVDSLDEAFDVAAQRGQVYVFDPSAGKMIRVPDSVANRTRGDLGPVGRDLASNDSFLSSEDALSTFETFDSVGVSRRRASGDPLVESIYRAQNFDQLPRVVGIDEIENLVSEGYTPLYRGLTHVDTFAEESDSLRFARDLLYGDYYGAPGSIGSGTYFTPQFARASNYTEEYGIIVGGVLDPNARIMGPGEYHHLFGSLENYRNRLFEAVHQGSDRLFPNASSELRNSFAFSDLNPSNIPEILQTLGLEDDYIAQIAIRQLLSPQNSAAKAYMSDPGRLIAMLGYDGYIGTKHVYQTLKPEYVILNRRAVIFSDEAVRVQGSNPYTRISLGSS